MKLLDSVVDSLVRCSAVDRPIDPQVLFRVAELVRGRNGLV